MCRPARLGDSNLATHVTESWGNRVEETWGKDFYSWAGPVHAQEFCAPYFPRFHLVFYVLLSSQEIIKHYFYSLFICISWVNVVRLSSERERDEHQPFIMLMEQLIFNENI